MSGSGRRVLSAALGVVAVIVAVVVAPAPMAWTALTLAVPFGVWWLFDREKRLSARWEAQRTAGNRPRPDPVTEAEAADELGLPESAAFWRSQPPLPDEQAWRARTQRARDLGR